MNEKTTRKTVEINNHHSLALAVASDCEHLNRTTTWYLEEILDLLNDGHAIVLVREGPEVKDAPK